MDTQQLRDLKVMENQIKSGVSKAWNEATNSILNLSIEELNKKQAEINYWKRQAYILHSKLGQCRECSNKENTKNSDLFFEIGGADCLECPDKDNNIKNHGKHE